MKKALTLFASLALMLSLFAFGGLMASAEGESEVAKPKTAWIVNPDAGTLLTGEASTEHVKFGTKSIKAVRGNLTGLEEWGIYRSALTKAVDLSEYIGNGYLHINFYVEDASKYPHLRFELNSAGEADKNSVALYCVGDGVESSLVDGWNHIALPLKDEDEDGKIDGLVYADEQTYGKIDWKAVNFAGVYFLASDANAAVWLDSIYVSDSAENVIEVPTTGNYTAVGFAVAAVAVACGLAVIAVASRKKVND